MKVKDPDDQVWRVTRRWVPWRRRNHDAAEWPLDFDLLDGADDPGGIGLAIALGLLLIVVAPIVVLALLLIGEFALLFLLLPFAVAARVWFGKQWYVEARRGFKPWWEEASSSWQASGLRIYQVAADIERGQPPPQTLYLPAPDVVSTTDDPEQG